MSPIERRSAPDLLGTPGSAALSQIRFWPGHWRIRWHSRRKGASRSNTTETVSYFGRTGAWLAHKAASPPRPDGPVFRRIVRDVFIRQGRA